MPNVMFYKNKSKAIFLNAMGSISLYRRAAMPPTLPLPLTLKLLTLEPNPNPNAMIISLPTKRKRSGQN